MGDESNEEVLAKGPVEVSTTEDKGNEEEGGSGSSE